MLKLDLPTDDVKREYKNKFLPGLVSRVQNGCGKVKLCDKIKAILLPEWNTDTPDTQILEDLLLLEPEALKNLSDDLWPKIRKASRFKTEKRLKKQLNVIFDYKGQIDGSKNKSYWLAAAVGRNTCAYCNRTYTLTVVKGEGKNDDSRIARPTFDHWYAHAEYPLMSISLHNLIPSCSICNSSAKGSTPFDKETHTHPYIHEEGHPDITFVAGLTDDEPAKWTVKIKTPPESKERRTIEDLHLDDIYAYHGELEVKDLMEFKSKYTADYLKNLLEKVLQDSKGKLTLGDVYRMLFGTEIKEENFLDRPLSKMKHDLLKEMGVI